MGAPFGKPVPESAQRDRDPIEVFPDVEDTFDDWENTFDNDAFVLYDLPVPDTFYDLPVPDTFYALPVPDTFDNDTSVYDLEDTFDDWQPFVLVGSLSEVSHLTNLTHLDISESKVDGQIGSLRGHRQ